MIRKLATAATIAALALLTRTPLAHAQKALVYCPVGVDASGCDRIVNALSSKFTEGVDRGYDGSAGTVDLSKVDLHHYSVFVVPSLADDGDKQPYALLRRVASRLHYAINGRVAVYSGAPDQGNSNRADKDALIQNLASWASDGHTRKTGLVGMVAFLDLSEDESTRYSWVHQVSLVDVSADAEDQSIGEATPVGTRGNDLLKVGGRQLAFSNMASNGLHIGNRGAARTEIGAIGGSTVHQSVLVTYSNADGPDGGSKTTKVSSSGGASYNLSAGKASLDVTGAASSTSGATLTTNKLDYIPGDTVTFTGTGFAPGDTVTITVHVDSTQSFPDRQFKSVADASGAIINSQLIIVSTDLNMFFTATAVANPSGLVAQTQFTDAGTSLILAATSGPAGTVVQVTTGGGPFSKNAINIGIYWDGTVGTTTGSLLATCSANSGGNITGSCSFTVPAATVGNHSVVATEQATPANSVSLSFNVTSSCTAASISVQPANVTTNALQSASFSVTAGGTNLTYQWQVSVDNGVNFTNLTDGGSVSGATTSSLTVGSLSGTDNGKKYRVVVAASCGAAVTSTAATLTVNKINQTTAVTVTAPGSVTYGATGTATATGGDGTGAYTFSAGASTGCSVSGTTVSVTDASGTCSLTATRAGDNNYNASSSSAAFTVTLNKAAQAALSLTVPGSITFGLTGTATTTGGSGTGAVTFDAGSSTGCSINASTGVITVGNASGTCSISAAKAGDNNYVGPVADGPKAVTLNKATQAAITLTVPASITYGATGTATTSGGSGTGTVTFAAGASNGCAIDPTTGVISVSNASGTCSVSASKAGDNNYVGPVSDGPKTVTLNKADQATVTVTAPGSVTFGTTGTATATGGTGTGAYSFDAGTSNGCSVAGTTVSVNNASGTCVLAATRAADNNYKVSTASAPFTVTLNKANQTTAVLVTAPSAVTYGTTGTAAASGGDGTGTYTFSAGTSTGCSVSGTTVSVGDASGNCSLTAIRGSDNNYNASAASVAFPVTLNKATQAALVLTVPTDITYGTTGTATTTGGSGTGALTFSAGTSTGCAVNASTGVISVSDATGTCSISASKAGDNNYTGPVSDGPKSVTLKKAAQAALTLTVPSSVTYGATGTATTMGGSGTGALTFSAGASTGCAVNPSTGVINVSDAAGTCSISASKAGDINYNGPVSDGPKSVTLNKATQSAVTVTAPGAVTYGTTGTAVASGGDGSGAYSFSAGTSTGCSVSGTTVSVSNASGTCVLTATRAGDNNYNTSAESSPFTVTLNKANQSAVSVTAPNMVTYGTTGTAAATGGDGTGAYSFSAGSSTGCSVSGTTVSVSNASGICSLTTTRAGDNNYNASAQSAPFSVTLNKANQTTAVLVTSPSDVTYGTTGVAAATGGDGTGTYSFSAGSSTGCSVSGTTVSVTDASGGCSLTAIRGSDNNYNASAASAAFPVMLHKATQTALSLTVPTSITYGTTGTATTSGGSGTGTRTFSVGASTGCAVDASTGVISVSNASGTCDISASKAGDNNYLGPVTDGPKSVALNKANQSAVTVTAPGAVTYGATGTAAASGGDGTGAYSFSAGGSTGCAVAGTTVSVSNASGSCSLTATRAGDNNYNASTTSAAFTVTLNKADQGAVTVTAPGSVTYGTTGTAMASGGDGTGSYSFDAGSSTGCAVSGTTVSVSNASGTCVLTATRAGDNNYKVSAASAPFNVTLKKANQTTAVLVTAPGAVTYGTTGTATASGGDGTGSYAFSAGTSTGCSVSGTTVSVNDASGSCALTATRIADDNYIASAPSAPFTVTLNKATQAALALTVPGSITYGATGTATTTGGSGNGAIGFSASGTGCSVDGSTGVISVTNASGTCSISASKAGDNNYNGPVSDGPKSVTLNKATQTALSLTVPASITYGTTGTATTAGGSGTGVLTFNAIGTGCSVNAATGVVSVTNASGTCSISASKAGDNNYNGPISDGPKAVTLNKAEQVVAWTTPAPITYPTTLAGVLNASVTTGDGTLSYAEGATPVTATTVLNAGNHLLKATAAATSNYNMASATASLTVNPAAATVTLGNLVQPVNNVQSPTAAAASGNPAAPVSVGFTFTYTVNGAPTQTKPTQVGVYPLSVDIVAGSNYTGHADGYFVVYDPTGGFVTGGGWIVADQGSCVQANAPTGVCTSATGGRANFGFVSKYEKGANVPSGNTEFQFQAGNLNFKSTSYQWLVVSGARAQYKGSGTINGQAGYDFILTAVDGSLPGGNNQDRFRIKITYAGNVVFDNQISATDTDPLAGASTALGGGSISIKSK